MTVSLTDQMETPPFKVEVSDYSVSVDEWRRAQSAPKDGLPELTEAQREVANKFGISEEQYARSVLAVRFGVQRLRNRATKLGEEVQKILVGVSAESRVSRVVADLARERWVIVIQTPNRQVGVVLPRDVGDDFLDFSTSDSVEVLNAKVRTSLGLGEKGISTR
jgi:hypothetical protein